MSGRKHVQQEGIARTQDENVFDLFQGDHPRHKVNRVEDSEAARSQIN